MTCCKIGCQETDTVAQQEVAFRNQQGFIVRTKIEWCANHQPETILEPITPVDILRDKGY